MTKEEAIQQLNIEKDSLRRLVIDCGITELKPKFEAISMAIEALDMAIEALSTESSRKWETCFSCPLAKGCPQIQGKSNDKIAKYAGEIPNGCPISMSHNSDLISRADAIERVELITKCEWDNNVIYRDEVIDALKFAPPAEAEPTVIRSRTFMRAEDFEKWAKRIRETNPNAVVIPCGAEVVSADAVSGEEYEETDGVIEIKKQSAKDVGEIKHIVVCSPNYTRYFYNDSMPTPYKGGGDE